MSRILLKKLMREIEEPRKYPDNSLFDLNKVEQELYRSGCPPVEQYVQGKINFSQMYNSTVTIIDVGGVDYAKDLIGKSFHIRDLTPKSGILKGSTHVASRLKFDQNNYTIPSA